MSLGRAIAIGLGMWAFSESGSSKPQLPTGPGAPDRQWFDGFVWAEAHDWIPSAETWSTPGRVLMKPIAKRMSLVEVRKVNPGFLDCTGDTVLARIDHYDADRIGIGATSPLSPGWIRTEYRCIPAGDVPPM